ncbi:unnamed protein product [Closterium sp. Naga37s-1]|nr:unnamed protein product [Closterium sp. Naga37s-1]
MVADGDALINLAHNFFFGDALLLAAGCQVCPTQITQPNNFVLGDTFDVLAGKCNTAAAIGLRDISVAGAGKEARVSVAGNCLTLSADAECAANATQRSTAACQAFCSITDNGPCDGHGECVPPAPASPSNFTCLCHAGYSALDLGNGSTCAVVNSTTTTVSSLSTGAIVGIAVGCFAGFVLLAAVLSCLLWPRGPKVGGAGSAMKKMEEYALDELKDSKLEASEEAIVAFADLALDCVKMPGTRRPDMKAVAHSLSALIDKFCPDKEPCEFVENLSFTGSEVSQSGALSKRSIASGSLNRSGRFLSGLGSTFRGLGSWAQFRLSGRY